MRMNIPVIKERIYNIPLRWRVALTALVLFSIFFSINFLIIEPEYTRIFVQDKEDDAHQLTHHLFALKETEPDRFITQISQGFLSEKAVERVQHMLDDNPMLEKIRIYNASGKLIFSTLTAEIGSENTHGYFWSIIAKGNHFTKVVYNHNTTMEGIESPHDVVESYVPVMDSRNHFAGAVEIYYNVSNYSGQMKTIRYRSMVLFILTALGIYLLAMLVTRSYEISLKEKERLQQNLLSTQRMASMGTMVAGVAQEINNPLTIAMGYLELIIIRNKNSTAELPGEIGKIVTALLRIQSIIQSIKLYINKEKIASENIDVHEIIEETVTLAEHNLGNKNTFIKTALYSNHPFVFGDRSRLGQVLTNLLTNAIAATDRRPNPMLPGHIKVTSETKAGSIMISVSDNGPGISRDILPHLFDVFPHAHLGIEEKMGLGLPISHALLQQMNGHIEVESTLGSGSIFTISLPLAEEAITS